MHQAELRLRIRTGRVYEKAISTVNALRVDTIPSELTSAKLQLQNVPWRTIPPVLTQLLLFAS